MECKFEISSQIAGGITHKLIKVIENEKIINMKNKNCKYNFKTTAIPRYSWAG